MDETTQAYINRVARLILPATHQTQLQHLQKSPKFEGGQPVFFPGYSVITPLAKQDVKNVDFYSHIAEIQEKLAQELPQDLLIPFSFPSFHLTVADLIWADRYQKAVQDNPSFEEQLKEQIRESFRQYQEFTTEKRPSKWQLLGLVLFPRALAVALVPNSERDYEQILSLRRSIYQNQGLIALGIQQQYHFTAHLTLGYFGDISPQINRDRLSALFTELSDQWLELEPQLFTIEEVQLCKFSDMTHFEPEESCPKTLI